MIALRLHVLESWSWCTTNASKAQPLLMQQLPIAGSVTKSRSGISLNANQMQSVGGALNYIRPLPLIETHLTFDTIGTCLSTIPKQLHASNRPIRDAAGNWENLCQKSVALSLAKYLAPAANLNRNGKDLNSPDLHFCLSRETKEICRRPCTLNPKQIIRESWTCAIWSATWDIILFTNCKHLPFFLYCHPPLKHLPIYEKWILFSVQKWISHNWL